MKELKKKIYGLEKNRFYLIFLKKDELQERKFLRLEKQLKKVGILVLFVFVRDMNDFKVAKFFEECTSKRPAHSLIPYRKKQKEKENGIGMEEVEDSTE